MSRWLYTRLDNASLNGAIRDLEFDLEIARGEMRDLINGKESKGVRVRKMLKLSDTLVALEDCLKQAVEERGRRTGGRSK